MRVLEGKNDFPVFWLLVLLVCLFFTAWNFAEGGERAASSSILRVQEYAKPVLFK